MIIYFKGKRHTFLNCFGLFSRQKKIVSSLLSRDPRYRFLRAFTNLTRSTFYLRRSREIKKKKKKQTRKSRLVASLRKGLTNFLSRVSHLPAFLLSLPSLSLR